MTSGRRPSKIRLNLLVLAGFLSGLVIVGFALASQPRSTASSSSSTTRTSLASSTRAKDAVTTFGDQGPCAGEGEAWSLSAATASLPYDVYVPKDSLTDTSSMTVWRCPGTEIELDFQSGITIFLDANGLKDPASSWNAMANADPGDTSVGNVQGQPAALIDPAKSTGGANGSVSVVLGKTWIVVEGNGKIAIDDLVRVADSLAVADSSSTSG